MIRLSQVHFEPTIDLGSILAASSLIISLLVMHSKNIKRITEMEIKINTMYKWFEENVINGER